jgi:hypothetical protein
LFLKSICGQSVTSDLSRAARWPRFADLDFKGSKWQQNTLSKSEDKADSISQRGKERRKMVSLEGEKNEKTGDRPKGRFDSAWFCCNKAASFYNDWVRGIGNCWQWTLVFVGVQYGSASSTGNEVCGDLCVPWTLCSNPTPTSESRLVERFTTSSAAHSFPAYWIHGIATKFISSGTMFMKPQGEYIFKYSSFVRPLRVSQRETQPAKKNNSLYMAEIKCFITLYCWKIKVTTTETN